MRATPAYLAILDLNTAVVFAETDGADSPEGLYRSVGAALSSWEAAEEVLARLFSVLVGAPFSQGIARAYGSVISSTARVDMLRQVIEAAHPTGGDEMQAHLKVMDRIRELASRRNEIAHGIVRRPQYYGGGSPQPGYYLFQPEYGSGKKRATHKMREELLSKPTTDRNVGLYRLRFKYFYSAEEIDAYRASFDMITLGVASLEHVLLGEQLGLLPKSESPTTTDTPDGPL